MLKYPSLAIAVRLLAFASLVGLAACGDDGTTTTGKGGSGGKGGMGGKGGGTAGSGGAGGSVGGSATAGASGSVGSGGRGGGTAGASGAGGSAGSAGTAGGSGGTSGSGGTAGGSGGTSGSGGTAGGSGGTSGSGGAAGSSGSGGTTDAGTDATDGGDAGPGAANGTACTAAATCASGFCVDGVCCESACAGICSSCAAAPTGQAAGLCRPITAGTDPDSDCPREEQSTCQHDGMCDGAGACRNWGVGTTCATESCSAGTYSPARVCNGAGTCLTVTTSSCGVYVCGGMTCKTMCSADADCISGYYCAGTTCQPQKAQGTTCAGSNVCASGYCVDNVCCESACGGACSACANAKTGATDGLCRGVTAGTDPDSECTQEAASSCGQDGQCNGLGACRKWASGTTCVGESCLATTYTPARTCDGAGVCQTVSTSSCGAYICGATACKPSCTTSADCSTGNHCVGTMCVALKPQGAACTGASECGSGNCVDGVCCESACTGGCTACAGSKTQAADGLCRAVTGGTDPDDECASEDTSTCGRDGQCDGAGACRRWTVGTVCAPSSCSGTTLQPASTCNGTGTCQMPGTTSCGAYMCGTTSCATTCGSNADCTAGNHCGGGFCVPQEANGTACLVTGDCSSGFCVDGVCCNTACTGTCNTCAATNSLGTCKAADPGTDLRNDCSASNPSTCGDDGTCDGAGACRKHVAGTQCLAATCSSATLHGAWTCNGTGTCNVGADSSCGAYPCDGAGLACATSCAADANCTGGGFCAAQACYKAPLNLAGNGDVEYGNGTGWAMHGGGGALALQNGAANPALVHGGTYALAGTLRTANYIGPGYYMPTGVGIYNVSAWVMQNENPTQTVALQVNLDCGAPTGSSTFPTIGMYGFSLPQGVWTQVTGTVDFTTPATCNPAMNGVVNRAHLYLNRAGAGTPVAEPNLFIDDVVVTVTDGHNLVGNPGLEANVLAGWTSTGGTLAVSNAVAKSGTYSVRVSGRTQTFQGPQWSLPLGAAKYTVTFNGLHSGTVAHNLVLQPTYTCLGGGAQYPPPVATASGAIGNSWNTITGTVTFPPASAPAGCKLTAASIYMQQESGTCGSGVGQIECPDLFVDDASITLAP